jgi:hypothetical protein
VTASRRPAALAIPLLVAAAAAVFGLDLLSGDALVGFTNFDLFAEFLPRHAYAGAAFARGELPLWDPHQIAGLPFLATLQGGVLYPPNALYALLPTGLAMGLLGGLHLALAGVFTYALCRELGSSPAGAGLGAVAFMLGGATLFALYHTNAIDSLPWLPLALACTARLARTGDLRLALALGACLALQFLAGRDYTFVMTAHAVAAFALWQAFWMLRDGRGARLAARHLLALALAAALAAGLAAPQWLPTLELAARSTRLLTGPADASLEIFGPLPPSFFLANLVNPERGPIRREFAGWIPLLCFAAGFRLWGRDRVAVFASLLAVLAVLLCFGSQTPLYAAYRALPLGSVFRLPDRFVTLFALALALGAARGFDRLLPAPAPADRLRALTPALVAAAALAAGLGWAIASGWLARGLAGAAHPWGWFWMYGLSPAHFAGLLPHAGIHLAAAAGVLALAAWRAGRSGGRAARAAVVALAAAELAYAFESPFLHPSRDAAPAFAGAGCYASAAEILGSHGRHLSLSLPDSYALKDKDGELHGGFSATHYEPLVTRRHALYFAALQAGGAPRYASPWNEASPFMGFLTAVPTPERQRLLDLLGVRAVLVDARPAARSPALRALVAGLEPAAQCRVPTDRGSAPVEIYANPRALPRAFLVSGLALAAGPEDALRQLLAPDFDPRRTAIVEAEAGLRPAAAGEPPGEARITDYASERVIVRAQAASPAWLVLTDSFDPDWTATRNGEPAEILPADGLFRAVALPPGEWEVAFRYRPRAFRLGAAAAAASLLAALWLARRWRPRGPAQGSTIASSSIS